jgi:hypothetical protein
MAVERDDLLAYLDRLLDLQAGRDFGPNGLQVEGGAIRRIVTGFPPAPSCSSAPRQPKPTRSSSITACSGRARHAP